jgi:hypothetical protein
MADSEELAHAWDVGFDAAAERAKHAILLAEKIGVDKALEQMKPVANPYRPSNGAK